MHQIVTIKLGIDFTEDLHQDVKLRRTYEFRPANVWDVLDLMGKLHETLVHEIEDAQDKVEFLEKLDRKVSTTEAEVDDRPAAGEAPDEDVCDNPQYAKFHGGGAGTEPAT